MNNLVKKAQFIKQKRTSKKVKPFTASEHKLAMAFLKRKVTLLQIQKVMGIKNSVIVYVFIVNVLKDYVKKNGAKSILEGEQLVSGTVNKPYPTTERKYHYLRGFAVASILWGIVFILSAHYILDKMA